MVHLTQVKFLRDKDYGFFTWFDEIQKAFPSCCQLQCEIPSLLIMPDCPVEVFNK